MPHQEDGSRTEPPVSVPTAQGARPAATATPAPLLDPPGVRLRCGSQGFHGVPRSETVDAAARMAGRNPTGPDIYFAQRKREKER